MPPASARTLPALLVLVGLAARGAGAQTPGLPVYGGGVSPGIELGALAGFSQSDSPIGKGVALGATGALAVWRLSIAGTIARFEPSGGADGRWSYGVEGGIKLLGDPLSPLAVYALGGAGAAEDNDPDVSRVYLPAGLSFTLTIPTPLLAIKPWVAPRVDILRTRSQGVTVYDEEFAFSTGVNFTLINGLSLRASYDHVRRLDPVVAFGAALHR